MSIEWWSRKVQGGYVLHEGVFKEVDTLRHDVNVTGANSRWPEVSKASIKLQFADGSRAPIDEVQFTFPEESWKLVSIDSTTSEAVFASRDVSHKRWRIVPGPETYVLSHQRLSLLKWLNAPTPGRVDRTDVTKWRDTEPQFYDAMLMSKQTTPFQRAIYYGRTHILNLIRTPTTQELQGVRQEIPEFLKVGWGLPVNEPQPYDRMSPKNRRLFENTPVPAPEGRLNYDIWNHVESALDMDTDGDYIWEIQPTFHPGRLGTQAYLRIFWQQDHWVFTPNDLEEPGRVFENDDDLVEDIVTLLDRGPEE